MNKKKKKKKKKVGEKKCKWNGGCEVWGSGKEEKNDKREKE